MDPQDPTRNKTPDSPGQANRHPDPQRGRDLPRRARFTLPGLVAAFFIAGPAAPHMPGLAGPEAKPAEMNAFTDRQCTDATETEGKIAIDDDLVTPVFSPYTGRVTKLVARVGDTVSPGDPLFTMQASELVRAQNDLITAAANLRAAKASLLRATTNEKRQHALFLAQGATLKGAALKDWQQSQADLATARDGVDGAAIVLAAMRNRLRILGKSDEDTDRIEAAANPLRLEADTVVGAPIAGIVMQRRIGPGQDIVSASLGASGPVYLVADLSTVWLTANARAQDVAYLHKGDPVEVVVPAYPDQTFQAKLIYVAAAIDPTTHRLPVRVEVENPMGDLKPGMSAGLRIITGEAWRWASNVCPSADAETLTGPPR